MTIPTVSTNALGYGAFLGLYANLRYQLLSGFDRAMINHFDVIGVALFFSTALRSVSLSTKTVIHINLILCWLVHTYINFCIFPCLKMGFLSYLFFPYPKLLN